LASHAWTASQSTSGNPASRESVLAIGNGGAPSTAITFGAVSTNAAADCALRFLPSNACRNVRMDSAHGHAASHAAMNAFQCAASDAAMRSRISPISVAYSPAESSPRMSRNRWYRSSVLTTSVSQ